MGSDGVAPLKERDVRVLLKFNEYGHGAL